MGDDRPNVYFDDAVDSWIIRASSIGKCNLELAFAGQGHEPLPLPAMLKGAFQAGHDLEPLAIQWLRDEGWTIGAMQAEGELVLSDELRIRFHPDGLGFRPVQYDQYVVEIKWLSDANWRLALRSGVASVVDEYAWQLSVMMHAYDLPGVWVFGNKGFKEDDAGVKPYCEHEGEIRYEFVEHPPVSLDTIRAKAFKVLDMVRGEDLLQSQRACDKPDSWPCRFRHLLPELEEDTALLQPDVLHIEADDQARQVDDLVRQFLYFKGQADENKQAYERARDELIKLAGGSETAIKRIVTPRWTVPVQNGRTPRRLDIESMPHELREELNKHYKPGTVYKKIQGIKRND